MVMSILHPVTRYCGSQAARQAWEEERERDRPRPGPTFDYGMQLVNNSRRANKHLGVCLLTGASALGAHLRRA